jgi:RNA polymerase sigma-70 factor, ECF subfamily
VSDVRFLFEEYHDLLYRYLVRQCGDGDVAADIAQETFIRWVQDPPEDHNPKGWLFAVATNLLRDRARVRSRRLELLRENDGLQPIGDAPPDPADLAEAGLEVADARAALAELSERDRTVLLLYHEGFSHKEIAEAIGTKTHSVGTLIIRATKKFAAHLTPRRTAPSARE